MEPVSLVSKDVTIPSFEDNVVPQVTSPAAAIEILPIKSFDKQVIEPKVNIKKKSSTLGLCSCFGSKAQATKEKTKTLAAPKAIAIPKADLPAVDMPVQSSNIASTLKTKGALRAPSTELPPVTFNSTNEEPVRLPSIPAQEKKRPAPKKPAVPEVTKPAEVIISPEAVVPSTNVDQAETLQTSTTYTEFVQPTEELLICPSRVEIEQNEEIQLTPPTPIPVLTTSVIDEIPAPIIEKQHVEDIAIQSSAPTVTVDKEPTQESKVRVENTQIKATSLTEGLRSFLPYQNTGWDYSLS